MFGLEPGMRVALPWLGYACGVCRYCNTGRETLCPHQLNMGYAIDGGFAEYALGYARHVVHVPDGISSADAAPLTCAGVTTFKAVKVSGATSSSLVAVFGAGGLGHLGIQYARIAGASVIAVDINPARLQTAREVGADHPVHPARRIRSRPSRPSAARTPSISTAVFPGPSSRPSARSRAAARWCASGCPPTTGCGSRSSRRCSAG